MKVWEATYLPFGGVHTSTGPNSNLRFPGQWFQSETDLHQNWMRDYDPTTGRYLQADPLRLVDGASIYGYALQNPGRYIDPRGEFVGPWIVACAAAGWGLFNAAIGYIIEMNWGDGCYMWQDFTYDFAFGAALGPLGNWQRSVGIASDDAARALLDDYFRNRVAPNQVTPGTRKVNNAAKPSTTGSSYHQTTHYDEFGRNIGRTDRTTHGRPSDHPDPHHHRRNPITGERIRNPSGSTVWPGLFGN